MSIYDNIIDAYVESPENDGIAKLLANGINDVCSVEKFAKLEDKLLFRIFGLCVNLTPEVIENIVDKLRKYRDISLKDILKHMSCCEKSLTTFNISKNKLTYDAIKGVLKGQNERISKLEKIYEEMSMQFVKLKKYVTDKIKDDEQRKELDELPENKRKVEFKDSKPSALENYLEEVMRNLSLRLDSYQNNIRTDLKNKSDSFINCVQNIQLQMREMANRFADIQESISSGQDKLVTTEIAKNKSSELKELFTNEAEIRQPSLTELDIPPIYPIVPKRSGVRKYNGTIQARQKRRIVCNKNDLISNSDFESYIRGSEITMHYESPVIKRRHPNDSLSDEFYYENELMHKFVEPVEFKTPPEKPYAYCDDVFECCRTDDIKSLVYLLYHNRHLFFIRKGEMSPIHMAAEHNSYDVCDFLLRCGADPNSGGASGWTPLHWASYNGHVDVAKLLVKYGAKADAKDYIDQTPVMLARSESVAENFTEAPIEKDE